MEAHEGADMECKTCGFLISESDDVVIISSSVHAGNCCDSITIPKFAIVERWEYQ